MGAIRDDLDRFYALLAQLAQAPSQGRPLRQLTGGSSWPDRGVYFFREPGEFRASPPAVPRIVRVGTHAVSAGSKSRLWGRLRNHRGGRAGGGNHRGSIFRLHVGAALLARAGEVLPMWGVGSSAPSLVRAHETAWERRVSDYIGSMTVLWVGVLDDPAPQSERAYIERNAIALLSNRLAPIDPPSEGWLGRFSPRAEIRRSGLWNLKHVKQGHDALFLDKLDALVLATCARAGTSFPLTRCR